MKAAQMKQYGGPEVVEVVEVATPHMAPGQVLVEVHAASLNPFDSKVRAGAMKDAIPLELPATLGGDIAGVVVNAGAEVQGLQVGDQVYGQASAVAGNSGALAEFATTAWDQVAVMPKGLDSRQAAALPLVGVSAWQALTQHLQLQAGQKLFIHGAGGIGMIALELARHLGAEVTITATGKAAEEAQELGGVVIDYKTTDFTAGLKDYDAVFDTVGGDDFNKALGGLRRGGRAVSMIAKADETRAQELGVTAITQATKVTAAALEALRALVEQGAVHAHVGRVFPLDQVQEAFAAREAGGVAGKVVVEVRAD